MPRVREIVKERENIRDRKMDRLNTFSVNITGSKMQKDVSLWG